MLKRIITHLLVWVCYIVYELSILLILSKEPVDYWATFAWFSLNVTLFYISAEYIFPLFEKKSSYILTTLLFLVSISLYLACSVCITKYLDKDVTFKNESISILLTDKSYVVQRLWRATWFIGLSVGYWFAKKSIRSEKNLGFLQKKHYEKELFEMELKKEIATSKLANFKSQINPHFMFNTLSFFYSGIYPLSKDIARSILLLSDIMRYVIETNDADGLTELTLEIKQIENYIILNQLRFNNKLKINFEYTGIPEHKRIPPFIFMTLVENALKYGDLNDNENPVSLSLSIQTTKLNFFVKNKINKLRLSESHGIGLSHLRERLDLFYKSQYKLEIKQDDSFYFCNLLIKL